MANFRGVLVRCTDGLKHVDVPEGVEEIGFMAFAECKSLESVYIPEGVTELYILSFACCKSLKSIVVPASVKSIGSYAFSECTSLKAVTLLRDAKICPTAISDCVVVASS